MISREKITRPGTGRAVVGRVHQYNSQYVNHATNGEGSSALTARRKLIRRKAIIGRTGRAVRYLKRGVFYGKAIYPGEATSTALINTPFFPLPKERKKRTISGNDTNRGITRTDSKTSKHTEQTRLYNKKKKKKEVLSNQASVPPEVSEVLYEILNSIDEKIRKGLTDETLLKMIAFIIKEIYTNKDIKNAETEKKFDILLSLFYNQFKDVFETHTIIVPIFLNYLVKTIKKAVVLSDKEDDRKIRKIGK